jgi:hypothetical protein
VEKSYSALASESFRLREWRLTRRALASWLLAALLACVLPASQPAAQTPVDVELVIAVDVSLSMDLEEQRLQRDGYVAAFRDAELHKAIAAGIHGRIAVVYMEWAGPGSQSVVIPWTLIDSPAAARAFAERLAAQPISRQRLTSIGAALQFARGLLANTGFAGLRRVVDVSGDGPNNAGPPAPVARDALVADGIVVNGLPIMLRTGAPSFFDLSDLDRYYAACVIGGAGAFMVPVKEIGELKDAIRRKLLLEISGLPEPEPQLIPAQAEGPETYDCLVGERQWRWYLDGVPN